MVSYGECVTLSDDEPMQMKSTPRCKNKACGDIETIVIDEESPQPLSKSSQTIELTDSCTVSKNGNSIHNFAVINNENKVFAEFLLKCLDLERSDGMLRIINKSLVKTYVETDKSYRNSSQFYRVLIKAHNRLEKDPEHKFSHVRDLIETLKLHVHKKRVQLVTLETNLRKNGINKKKHPRKPIVIDLDDEPSNASTLDTINLDEYEPVVPESRNEDKENISNGKSQPVTISESSANGNSQPVTISELSSSQPEGSSLLEPQVSITLPHLETQDNVQCKIEHDTAKELRIKEIEDKIKMYKDVIEECELAEVTNDSICSPYIRCDSYKREIVNLYKELCHLVGEEPVKKRSVRLQVLEGHPPGPIRRLERFINDNIGEDGVPHFPDFCDVVQCVIAANIEEKLGWNKKMIMKEANSLFTQCGRALQKQRQRREYREQIISRVKAEPELLDHDPADHDPKLLARLEENRRVALKKENELLERYSMLQNLPSHILRPGPSIKSNENSQNNNNNNNNNNNEENKRTSPDIEDEDEDSNFEPPVVTLSHVTQSNNENMPKEIKNNETKETPNELKIKEEPMDIAELLEELGDNFTSTIIDIQDPLLVIEISSDESDDDDIDDIVMETDLD